MVIVLGAPPISIRWYGMADNLRPSGARAGEPLLSRFSAEFVIPGPERSEGARNP